jgi:hypothetical protein
LFKSYEPDVEKDLRRVPTALMTRHEIPVTDEWQDPGRQTTSTSYQELVGAHAERLEGDARDTQGEEQLSYYRSLLDDMHEDPVSVRGPGLGPSAGDSNRRLAIAGGAMLGLALLLMVLFGGGGDSGEIQGTSLRIDTAPAGAHVKLDGVSEQGSTPLTIIGLKLNRKYRLELSLGEDRQIVKEIELTQTGQQSLFIQFPDAQAPSRAKPVSTGLLSLRTTPVLKVYMGDKLLGTTPLSGTELPSGGHELVLRDDKLQIEKTVKVSIPAGGKAERAVVLQKGKVSFDIKPKVVVYWGKQRLGPTPIKTLSLYEGVHTFRFVSTKKRINKTVRVKVRPGKKRRIRERFR